MKVKSNLEYNSSTKFHSSYQRNKKKCELCLNHVYQRPTGRINNTFCDCMVLILSLLLI